MGFVNLSTSVTSCVKRLSTERECVKNLSICDVDNKKCVEYLSTKGFSREWRNIFFKNTR